MKTMTITIQGDDASRSATINRIPEFEGEVCAYIEIILHITTTCKRLGTQTHDEKMLVGATDRQGIYEAAQHLQAELDGYAGTNGDIEDYHQVLQRFAD